MSAAGESEAEERLRFAVGLARRAGELALCHFRAVESLTIESKGHQDLVSNADREVERMVREALAAAYPEDGIVGEEGPAVADKSGHVWVIDPIDGTANFVCGIPAWCVVVARVGRTGTELGVIHEPSSGETFWARRGGGAFLNGKPIQASARTSLSQGSVGTGISNRREVANVARLIDLLAARGGVFFRNASGALMLAYAASGRLLAYCEEHMNAWDCLAGLLIVQEAGGRILAPDPATALERGAMVVAGGAGVFEEVQALCCEAFR